MTVRVRLCSLGWLQVGRMFFYSPELLPWGTPPGCWRINMLTSGAWLNLLNSPATNPVPTLYVRWSISERFQLD